MNLAKLSIKNPTLILATMLGIVIAGGAAFRSMSIDLFPTVSIPIISVVTIYPGAGPSEIENLVSRPIEEQISAISGLKRLSSKSLDGMSQVVAEFKQGVNVDRVEQEVRDKVNLSRNKLPKDIREPIIRRFDPADQPILILSLTADMNPAALFDYADQVVKPRLEQVNNVGAIEIYGGRKREIHVLLDRRLLASKEMSVFQVANQIGASGENIPSGKVNVGSEELIFRGLGEFTSIPQISNILVSLYGNERPTSVGSLGKVIDTLEDEKTRTFVGGKPSLFLYVYRQAGTNTIAVADGVSAATEKINNELSSGGKKGSLQILVDSSRFIRENVKDVYETIILAILLTVITVYFFLGNLRATLITGLALPVALVGAFILMSASGFSINIISLLALSLSVGLLVDDAIVVIENIYRRIEAGSTPKEAADQGTNEIQLSVFAITLVVISVFIPVAFMSGMVGQFLKQFGLTIAFAMGISFFVALTLIPMLAAYFTDSHDLHGGKSESTWARILQTPVRSFDRFQTWLEDVYTRSLQWILKKPLVALAGSLFIFGFSLFVVTHVPKAFMQERDQGEVLVDLELPPGTNLDGIQETAQKVEQIVKSNTNIDLVTLTIGGQNNEANKSQLFIRLKHGKAREGTTAQFKEKLRKQLAGFAHAQPVVKDFDMTGGIAGQPIILNLIGSDQAELESYAKKLSEHLKGDSRIKDVNSNFRPGKPEYRIMLSENGANTYGINSKTMGLELRAQVEGFTPAKFREAGKEYDVRVRLLPEQRNLKNDFKEILVPNVNHKLVRLSDVANLEQSNGAAEINRQDRGRYIQITASLAPGVGLGDVIKDIEKVLSEAPKSVRYGWMGDTENMKDTGQSAVIAIGFAIVFIYLILASLYGSFVTPITILTALPLALCGAFYALFIAHETLNLFSILGIFLLLGVSGKNSILLVDFANQMIAGGKSRSDAILAAGRARLRPILMTSFALIAGTLPIAIGLNEASKMRTSMGWAIIGGIISSTLLTLIVVPAIFSYMDRYRVWSKTIMARLFLPKDTTNHSNHKAAADVDYDNTHTAKVDL